ncbi:MAG: hypothetical protein CMF25_04000 [Kangiellaceae bacterium]|nr:hypothetical protein [Kangiellaceae bacterium]|tara:strand:+ start:5332 stop:5787 length:456 start_codon:yes stop_codon:yes gene_type:complete
MSKNRKPWLEDVYAKKKLRTVSLVRDAVAVLSQENRKITLSNIVKQTVLLDAEGKGVSHSAILNNEDAYCCYKNKASKLASNERMPRTRSFMKGDLNPTSLCRDIPAKRRRLRNNYTKEDLIELVIKLQDKCAEYEITLKDKWVDIYDNID